MSGNGKNDEFKPEILINSFSEKDIAEYIEKLENINMLYEDSQPIIVHIDSYGGSIYGLSQLYEHLISMPNPIVTYTTSKAMSAGAIILAAAGTRGMRVASPNSSIMVHELQCGAFGDIKDVENETEMIKRENTKWMGILAKSMGLKSAKDIRKMLLGHKGRELYLSPHQAKKLGLIDEVAYLRMKMVQGWEILRLPKPLDKTYLES